MSNKEWVATREKGDSEGRFVAPEGGAIWAAAKRLAPTGRLGSESRAALFNTGSCFKHPWRRAGALRG